MACLISPQMRQKVMLEDEMSMRHPLMSGVPGGNLLPNVIEHLYTTPSLTGPRVSGWGANSMLITPGCIC